MSLGVDGGCFAGHDLATGLHYPLDRLVADLDRLSVGRALVGSYRCIYQDIREGNLEASRWAAALPTRIVPLGIVHPAYYGESPDRLLAWMRDELGFKIVALFSSPQYYAVAWETPAVRAIGAAAARLGLVLQAGIKDDVELDAVTQAWGALDTPVYVRWMRGHRYTMIASEIAAARQFPNLRFDVGNVTSTGAVRVLADQVGAHRLFAASNTPHNIPDCAHAVLRESGLDSSDLKLVAGDTIGVDLGLAPSTPLPGANERWSALCTRPKVDVHWHHDHWNLGEPALSVAEQLAAFDRYGYERIITSSIRALNDDLSEGNALTARWADIDSRVFGLIVVNPLQPERSLQEIERYASHPRFVGVKTIQDVFGMGLDDEAYEPLLQAAEKRSLPVVAHLPGMDEAARRHPALQFMATHGNWGRTRRLAAVTNIAFDISTGHALRHESQLARFVESVGSERVLYGSDGQLVSPGWTLAKLNEAALPPELMDHILRTNAYRVFPKLHNRTQ